MKVTEQCAACGSMEKAYNVEIPSIDRTKFLLFTQELQASFHARGDPRAGLLFIPPTKYPKQPLIVPAEGENPCTHCEIGRTNAGPGGCNKESHCMAYMYYMLTGLTNMDDRYKESVALIRKNAEENRKKTRRPSKKGAKSTAKTRTKRPRPPK
jgi:hypothetical protein